MFGRALSTAFILLALSAPSFACQGAVVGASWYGTEMLTGRDTASGEPFDPGALTAAHRSLAFGTRVKVTYKGKSVVVRINDRGPFVKGRSIDISSAAADRIGLKRAGHAKVCLEVL